MLYKPLINVGKFILSLFYIIIQIIILLFQKFFRGNLSMIAAIFQSINCCSEEIKKSHCNYCSFTLLEIFAKNYLSSQIIMQPQIIFTNIEDAAIKHRYYNLYFKYQKLIY